MQRTELILPLLFLALALPAWSTISMVQSTSAVASTVGSIAATYTNNVRSGNFLIVFIKQSTTTQTVTVTDTLLNTWTAAGSQQQATDGSKVWIYYANSMFNGADTITVTFSATNNFPWIAIYEYAGLATVSTFDKTVGAVGTATAVSTGATAATTVSSELVFCGGGLTSAYNGVSGAGVVGANSYVIQQSLIGITGAANSTRGWTASLIVAATGAQTCTVTIGGTTTNWSALAVTFKAAVPRVADSGVTLE